MKPSRSSLLLAAAAGLVALAGARATAATVDPIIAPPKRLEALDRARAALAQKEVPDKVPNPFYSESFNEVLQGGSAPRPSGDQQAATPAVTPAVNKTARGLLESIAASLRPSGYFVIGGQPTLVFGQKRVKAGGTLTINFEGKEYTLEVTALDRTNFTLRLDREEFTRPIK
jgi:hypothetical protein